MLQEFIELYRNEIIKRCRAKVAQRSIPPPTAAEIDHGVPLFLSQLVDALRPGAASTQQINQSAILHGHDLLRQGFTVSQVVHDYGDVCQTVTELASETNTPIDTEDFRTLNHCLDDAIAGAVTEFGRERQRSDVAGESARGAERLGFFAHELRNLTNTAIFAFEVLKTGDVGVGGTTGRVLDRSLMGLRTLIGRSLEEVRFTQGINTREPLLVSTLIEEVAHGAALEASARGITFIVEPTDEVVFVNADRQVLAAAVMNLLQNAVKFTKPRTTVTLRVVIHMEQVLIEVEDECGGLPDGEVSNLFQPFRQRSTDRSGVGLGLAFARWAAEANQGQLVSHNIPGKGCIFKINLPRTAAPVVAMTQEAGPAVVDDLRDEETKRRRDEETKRRRDEETKRRSDAPEPDWGVRRRRARRVLLFDTQERATTVHACRSRLTAFTAPSVAASSVTVSSADTCKAFANSDTVSENSSSFISPFLSHWRPPNQFNSCWYRSSFTIPSCNAPTSRPAASKHPHQSDRGRLRSLLVGCRDVAHGGADGLVA